MAHGGHSGGSHAHYHHHHSRGGYNSNSDVPLPILIPLIIVILALALWLSSTKSDIGGKEPLEGTYTDYPVYLIDNNEYLSDHELIINGLKYLHEKTNVQLVVVVATGSWSDTKVVDEYYKLFDDEAHMLIIITSSWYEDHDYYAIGDLTNSVIDDRAAKYLIEKIDNSRDGKKWEEILNDFADRLLSDK